MSWSAGAGPLSVEIDLVAGDLSHPVGIPPGL